MKTIAWLAGIGTLLAGVFYMVISLNRWEWNRALFFGLIVLIAEVALATGLVLRRLARLEHNLKGPADPEVVQDPPGDPTDPRSVRLDARVLGTAQRVHHVPRRRGRAPLGGRLDGRSHRVEDLLSRR